MPGARAYPVVRLTWAVIGISVAVISIIAALVLIASLKNKAPLAPGPDGKAAGRPRSIAGLTWIYVGTGLSTVVLLAVSIWTMVTLVGRREAAGPARTDHRGPRPPVVVGGALRERPALATCSGRPTTFHIPVGVPVRVNLVGDDVIHSFWVPALSGKMDTIPGQTNSLWIEADKAGTYRGQCTEYCGAAARPHGVHGHGRSARGIPSLVGAPARARARARRRRRSLEGEAVFVDPLRRLPCGRRDATRAASLGPNLSHLMQRKSIAAGTLPNKPGQLSAWIADPQHIKPGSFMPRLNISGPDLAAIRTFLQTLN